MADRVRIDIADLADGEQRIYEVAGQRIAVFRVDGQFHAIDNTCPHRGASLGAGKRDGLSVRCPLHGWTFDLESGACREPGAQGLRRYDAFRQGNDLYLDLSSAEEPAVADGIHRYLVRYGAMGWVGRFGSIERIECGYRDRVLVHTGRGLEAGEVLAGPDASAVTGKPAGELLRRLTDEERYDRLPRTYPHELLDACRLEAKNRGLPIEIIDGERLFDGESVVVYFLGVPDPGIEELAADMAALHGLRILFSPVVETEASGGCGSGQCGCGTG